jgi:transcriptional regulator with XRE-family HTH domain
MQEANPRTTDRHGWRTLRLSAGLGLREVANLAGIPAPYLSQIETGRMVPTAAEAAAILRAITAATRQEETA